MVVMNRGSLHIACGYCGQALSTLPENLDEYLASIHGLNCPSCARQLTGELLYNKHTHRCEWCRDEYIAKRQEQRFCSNQCAGKWKGRQRL